MSEDDNTRNNRNRRSTQRRWCRDASGRLVSMNRAASNRNESRSRSRSRSRETTATPQLNGNTDSEQHNIGDSLSLLNFFEDQLLNNNNNNSANNILNNMVNELFEQLRDGGDRVAAQEEEGEELLMEQPQRAAMSASASLTDLETVLNNMRPMIYNMNRELNNNSFTLKLTVSINGALTIFDNVNVSRVDQIMSFNHRKVTLNEEKQNSECGICIANFKKDENVTKLQCNHEFHEQCINTWLVEKGQCPFCRQKVITFKCESQFGVVYI